MMYMQYYISILPCLEFVVVERIVYVLLGHAELNELYFVELARSCCYVRLVHHAFGGRDRNERQIESGVIVSGCKVIKFSRATARLVVFK